MTSRALLCDALPHLHRGIGGAHHRFGDRIADVAQFLGGLVRHLLALVQRLTRRAGFARGGVAILPCFRHEFFPLHGGTDRAVEIECCTASRVA